MRHFGYFMTESTGHLSEYVPWFRSSERALKAYCDEPGFGGASGAYYEYCKMIDGKFKKVNYLDTESKKLVKRSVEYCSYILEAKETGNIFRLNGNVRNDDFISNLPAGCCVEVPVFVDRLGLHPQRIGNLPAQCAALNQSNITVQSLAVEAGLSGDPELVVNAIAMDPLSSASCTLEEIRRMVIEMFEAEREWLPQFRGRKPLTKPMIKTPKNLKRVQVPLDPALAIANRFGELATRKI
jgi:alpha-galactosidase